jgi:hypothetical protein
MRQFLFLLIGLLALGATMPAAQAQASPMTRHHHPLPPGHCSDEGQAAVHTCLGCAIDPAEPAAVEPMLPVAMSAPIARLVSTLSDHRPGFDPPPPRSA